MGPIIECIKSWSKDFGAFVQLVAAVVLVAVTCRYVSLTAKLLEAQIDPAVSWFMDHDGKQPVLRITNRSTHPVTGFLVSAKEVRFYAVHRKLERTPSITSPRIHAADVLKPNETASIELGGLASKAVILAENQRKAIGGEVAEKTGGLYGADEIALTHVLEFRISYERQLDRKPYSLRVGPYMPWTQDGITYIAEVGDFGKAPRPEDYGLRGDPPKSGAE
jgi:hypothetical protein